MLCVGSIVGLIGFEANHFSNFMEISLRPKRFGTELCKSIDEVIEHVLSIPCIIARLNYLSAIASRKMEWEAALSVCLRRPLITPTNLTLKKKK